MFAGTPASELSLPTVRALHGLRIAYPQMTAEPFTDLLSAFAQDVVKNGTTTFRSCWTTVDALPTRSDG